MPNEPRAGARHGAAALCALIGLAAGPVPAQEPLSAIDWLSRSVATVPPPAPAPAAIAEPRVTRGAVPVEVAVTPLDGPSPDAAGLLPARRTGLPQDLWGMGRTTEIANRIAIAPTGTLPALQSLLSTLLLAEADAPADSGGKGLLLLARVDKLLAMGALEGAETLLDASGKGGAEVFRRQFDIALLTGTEDTACEVMQKSPDLAPTFPARIFCLARSGDWNAAALTLRTAQALGFVDDQQDALLSRFLDPDLYEEDGPLPPPTHVTPLIWRLMEAIGEPLPTQSLPIAFAHAELRDTAGWKGQIEAAERLARVGALEPNLLLGLYTERQAAASGGVWERVRAFQTLDTALTAGDAVTVAQALPEIWTLMAEAELEVPFARLVAERLAALPLSSAAAELAFRIALLDPDRAGALPPYRPEDATGRFLLALSEGRAAEAASVDGLSRAIAQAFRAPVLSETTATLLDQNRRGEAILQAISEITGGLQGNPAAVTEGLSLLRKLGLEQVARRTGLELLLLERRG